MCCIRAGVTLAAFLSSSGAFAIKIEDRGSSHRSEKVTAVAKHLREEIRQNVGIPGPKERRAFLSELQDSQPEDDSGVGTPPPVDKYLLDVQGVEVAETEQSYQIKAVSAALHARSSSSAASSALMHVQLLKARNALKKSNLDQALSQATNSAQMAAEYNTAAQASLTAVKEIAKAAVDEAKVLAVTEVQKALIGSYHNLESWRSKVLVNPVDKAKRAGAAAAEPYFKMIGQFQARMGQYGAESGMLMGQAHNAVSQADAIAGGAQGKMDAGDVMGARSDLQAAKALQVQGTQMGSAAQALDAQVRDMNKIIPMYIAQAHQAAWIAEYKMNPDGLPPPPVDANFAFTPPPPPAF